MVSRWNRISISAGALFLVSFCAAFESSATKKFTDKDRQYWALQSVRRPALPAVKDSAWVRNPIDAFILLKLEDKGIKPGPSADKITLIRRVTFDLTGLPPTPEDVEAFLTDRSAEAYERLVDRLLASPHYGERWARHWLDAARYAESDGFRADEYRPNVWRYRDYVIEALNQDKPYNRFVQEQIAGDEMWPDDPKARVATAFSRHYPDEWNARDLMQRRQDILQDVTDAVGSAFLGLTFGCAKCHDHKFDPILHRDYYRLQAFFAHTANDDAIPMWSKEQREEEQKKSAAWEEATRAIREELEILVNGARSKLIEDEYFKFPQPIKDAVFKDADERTPFELQMAHRARVISHPSSFLMMTRLKGEDKKRYDQLLAQLKQFDHLYHSEEPMGVGMRDLGPKAPPTHVLAVGNYARELEEVEPGFLTILDPTAAKIVPPNSSATTGRRTALAKWLTDPANPLTARVMVNRLWHHHFGVGIVSTPGDFGRMGQKPTHSELLDWLSSEFVQNGWSLKHMHRLMVTSNAYRQSSAYREEASKTDSLNRLLWRFRPQRLEAEAIRDSALSVSGLLNPAIGGPSVSPSLPLGMPPPAGGWTVSKNSADQNRRSVYISVRRTATYPMLSAFDMPESLESCSRRTQTTTAPQALTMLNSDESLDWAQGLASRVLDRAGADPARQATEAFRLAYSRKPDSWEMDRSVTFLSRQRGLLNERAAKGEKLAAPSRTVEGVNAVDAAALVDLCLALINSNEFVYRF
ncbi:MAG TPA: DUF1549 and DUF1553 domain-containing protein [Bryobacteraceae bacterium]|nr:DUF1549 and DUF1553 domain-containing protein [Bryobacteraceae bacterium]